MQDVNGKGGEEGGRLRISGRRFAGCRLQVQVQSSKGRADEV